MIKARFLCAALLLLSAAAFAQSYDGPIIDMHIHAYDQSPMYGMPHPPTLRGETYSGVANAEELKEQVLAAFDELNIVKAVVTNGHLWFDQAPDLILRARSDVSPDRMAALQKEGELDVVAEVAPFYRGVRADDP